MRFTNVCSTDSALDVHFYVLYCVVYICALFVLYLRAKVCCPPPMWTPTGRPGGLDVWMGGLLQACPGGLLCVVHMVGSLMWRTKSLGFCKGSLFPVLFGWTTVFPCPEGYYWRMPIDCWSRQSLERWSRWEYDRSKDEERRRSWDNPVELPSAGCATPPWSWTPEIKARNAPHMVATTIMMIRSRRRRMVLVHSE